MFKNTISIIFTLLYFLSLSNLLAWQGDSLFNLAIEEAGAGRFDQAVDHCLQAAETLAEEGNHEDWVAAQSFAARCAMRSSTYSLIEIRQMLEKAVEGAPFPKDDYCMGRLQLYYGWFLASRLSDYYKARQAYEQCRSIMQRYGIESEKFVTRTPGKDIYKPLAQIYIQLGESEKAIALMERAVKYMRENEQVYDIPELFADWGILHHDLGQEEKALARYQQGLEALESAFGEAELAPEDQAYFNNTKGLLLSSQAQSLLEQGEVKKARERCRQALALLSWEDYRSGALSVMGHVVAEEEGNRAAIPYFEDAIAYAGQFFPFYSRRIAKIENELARTYREEKQFEKALSYAQKALSRVVPGVEAGQLNQLPDPSVFYPENTIMEVLTEKGAIYKAWYDATAGLDRLELARRHYELAIRMEEVLNEVYTYQSSMLTLVEQSHARHEAMLEVIYALYEKKGSDEYVAQAFTYAEKSRAVVLNRALTNERAIRFAGDTALFKREKALQAQLIDYQRLLFELRMEGADTHQIASVNREIYRLKDRYDALIRMFEENNRRYHRLRHDHQLATLDGVKRTLGKQDLFVEYFLGKESQHLYILAVGKNQGPHFIRRPLPAEFEEDMEEFIRRLKDWNFVLNNEGDPQVFRAFADRARQYYRLLLPEKLAVHAYDRLIVVPDGQLNLLPFDLLLTREADGAAVDYAGLDYLIKEAAVNYAFSATVMLQPVNDKKRKLRGNYLGIAPDYSGSSAAFPPVPNNQEAVEAFRKLFKGKALTAREASIDGFLAEAGRYKILHFYGHAKAYPARPMSSWMAFTATSEGRPPFAQNEVRPPTEGLLGSGAVLPEQDLASLMFMFELYSLDLDAELAVLSACETGAGKVALGEGVISLARAFRYAGCPSTLMSLWEANDYQGEVAFLMEQFFKNLKNEEANKDEALRQAKLAFLADPKRSSHPAYWASFVLIGNNEPVKFNDSSRLWWTIPLLLIGVLLGAALRKIRSRKSS